VVYKYIHTANTLPALLKSAAYRTSNTPISLTTTQNSIVVADIMKSITVLELKSSSEIVETARHFAIAWSTAVEFLETSTHSKQTSDSYLLSDHSGNLLVLRKNATGVTAEDRRRLETTGEYHLGELVNRIQRVEVEASPDAPVIPRAFLATAEGGIYLVATIAPKWQNTLIELQGRLGKLALNEGVDLKIASLGYLGFESYRSYKTPVRQEDAPYRFVDGECIEDFLNLGNDMQEELVKGLGDVEDVTALVEVLKRIH
jgi:DNA damage-binding protein 1